MKSIKNFINEQLISEVSSKVLYKASVEAERRGLKKRAARFGDYADNRADEEMVEKIEKKMKEVNKDVVSRILKAGFNDLGFGGGFGDYNGLRFKKGDLYADLNLIDFTDVFSFGELTEDSDNNDMFKGLLVLSNNDDCYIYEEIGKNGLYAEVGQRTENRKIANLMTKTWNEISTCKISVQDFIA